MKYLFLLACICHVLIASAQKANTTSLHPVAIGERMPDFTFKHLINYPSPTAKLSDFKGKLIILDMWSTWCTSCIEAFPKMQALQDKFKDKVQILLADAYPATDDPNEKVKQVLTRVKERTGVSVTIPMPLHDTLLNNLFPHKLVSHVVVIDSSGRVRGITYTWGVTEENIQAILAGENVHLPVKNDWSYDSNSPLFINDNGGDESDFTYRSVITPFEDGLGSIIGNDVDSNGLITRFYVVNYPLLSLFRIAYPAEFSNPPNRIIIKTVDSAKFIQRYNEAEDNNNSYCYEIDAAATTKVGILKYMQEDLYRSFHVVVTKEDRMMSCYVLKPGNAISTLKANNDSTGEDIETTSLHKFIHNKSISELTAVLNNTLPNPVIDETGIDNNISIDFPFEIYNYNATQWSDFLAKKGIEMIEEERKVEVTVITNKIN